MYGVTCTVLLVQVQSLKVMLLNKNSLTAKALILVYVAAEVKDVI